MLTSTNPAGFMFVWPERSDYIEIYHDNASYSDLPVEVLFAGDLNYSQGALNKLANETINYARAF